jgi:hypothetical protein
VYDIIQILNTDCGETQFLCPKDVETLLTFWLQAFCSSASFGCRGISCT